MATSSIETLRSDYKTLRVAARNMGIKFEEAMETAMHGLTKTPAQYVRVAFQVVTREIYAREDDPEFAYHDIEMLRSMVDYENWPKV